MNTDQWTWLTFDGDKWVIGHAVHTTTREAVIADLVSRGCGSPVERVIGPDGVGLDMPGMIVTTRPMEQFNLDGLALSIPSEDCAAFLMQLEGLKLRDGNYYKLKGWMRAVVLSPTQRDILCVTLKANLPIAEQRALEFYAVTKSPSEVLREAAARSTGQPIEKIPNLGGNRVDRFRPRGSGKA